MPLPMESEGASKKQMRKEKLEQIRKDDSALVIQAVWRGRNIRSKHDMRRATQEAPPAVLTKERSILSPSNNLVDPNQTSSPKDEYNPDINLSRQGRRRSSSLGAADKYRKRGSIASSANGDDDDDLDPEPLIEDVEEIKMERAALLAQQSSIIALEDVQSIKREKFQFQASVAEEPPLIEWPEPYVEDWSNWPTISDNDRMTEDWVLRNKCLYIRTVTWNLCARKPPKVEEIRKKLLPTNMFHLYVIGSEECERSIAQSAVNTSKKNWEAFLGECLGSNYQPIRAQTLQAIHIIVFAHKSIAYLCSEVTSGAVPTGIGNTLGNKGGVAIELVVGKTRIVFVNSHLAAHQTAVKQRNADFHKISRSMPSQLRKRHARKSSNLSKLPSNFFAGAPILTASTPQFEPFQPMNTMSRDVSMASTAPVPSSIPKSSSIVVPGWAAGSISRDVSSSVDASSAIKSFLRDPSQPVSLANYGDRVIFMGDMNYRVRGNRSAVDKLLELNMHEVMINNDQLIWSMSSGLAFEGFKEPPLRFRPTYKLDRGSDTYDTSAKRRIPAWTDRILYVENGLECLAYNSDSTLQTSDHRPVYASFRMDIDFNVAIEALQNASEEKLVIENFRPMAKEINDGVVANNESLQKLESKPLNQEFTSESAVCSIM